MTFQRLTIGIPKEIMAGERRVAATPEIVRKMVSEGAKLVVEISAGEGSFFTDNEYRAAGAELVVDAEEIFSRSDIILKVKEPRFSSNKGKHEVDMMKKDQYLIAFLHPASPANHQMVQQLASKGVIAISLDSIPRITRAQPMDALTSMSTVAGYKAMLMAANMLPVFIPMMSSAAGMSQPANVLVIGTGVAGLQSLAVAKRLGAVVQAVDIRPEACEQAMSLGAKIIDVGVPAEVAVGKGGYALKLPAEWLGKERQVLKQIVSMAEIVILTALIPGKVAPVLITEEMVKSMKTGSVIIDVAIDQGGNCEISELGKLVTKYGVSVDGTPNIPSMLAMSSTRMFANNMYNFVDYLVEKGRVNLNMDDEIIASALVTKDGKIIHAGTLEAMNLK
ncbi:MAG: NAD(P) transhydrogenase subunit alpha [Sedimentisphaerales bacterium]|nr:NAD(P) transhydrogenase subunit alpha [Sedimentisphaerales bacterium]